MHFLVSIILTCAIVVTTKETHTFPLIEGPLLGKSLDCADVDECEHITTGYDSKICGTNGKTFNSLCEFMRAHCKERSVNFTSYGECSVSEKCFGERKAALIEAKTKKGVFIPGCNPDGTFKAVQCHKDTGFCWCSSALGQAVRGTVTQSAVPDCHNLTHKNPEDTSTVHPPIWFTGIPPENGFLPLTPEISPTQIPAHTNSESINIDSPEGETIPELSSEGKKKPKRPRGCEGRRRDSFNKNMLKNVINEFKIDNKFTDSSSDSALQSTALRWKFDKMNLRKDNRLRRTEYKGIQKIVRRSFKPRKCAKKFPKFCDRNGDKSISLEEWLTCFTSEEGQNEVFVKGKPHKKKVNPNEKIHLGKGPVKKPRPCDYEQMQALENGENVYVPKCDGNGKYRPVQCYGSNITASWFCFCVNVESGSMIENTSMNYSTPNCSVSWPSCPSPDKEEKFLRALRNYFIKYAKENILTKQEAKSTVVRDDNVVDIIFHHIDANRNNYIEQKERRRLKKLIPRKDKRIWNCGKKIHVICDINADSKISLQEFFTCVSLRTDQKAANESFEKKPSNKEMRRTKLGENPFIDVLKSEGKI